MKQNVNVYNGYHLFGEDKCSEILNSFIDINNNNWKLEKLISCINESIFCVFMIHDYATI